MAITKEQRHDIVKKFQKSELDTGSCEVQVALISNRIRQLTEHFKVHPKDYHGQRGMIQLINQRRRLLNYLKKIDNDRYLKVIGDLGLRK